MGSLISGVEVTKVVKKFLECRALLVDTSLQHHVNIRHSASRLADRGGLITGGRRVCSNWRGITLLSLPVKVYSGVLERRVQR